jgi:hypothetical protein
MWVLHIDSHIWSPICCCQAAAVDAAIARGEPAGPLAGVPIAIKVWTAGGRVTGVHPPASSCVQLVCTTHTDLTHPNRDWTHTTGQYLHRGPAHHGGQPSAGQLPAAV